MKNKESTPERSILLGKAQVISLVSPSVQRMLDHEGLYVGSDPNDPSKGEAPLVSMGGKVFALDVGKELEPEGFIEGTQIDGPFRASDWRLMSESPDVKSGWFAAALLPVNHAELELEQIHGWRNEFGYAKVWYNAASVEKWWVADATGPGSRPVGDRMTHWAELPSVPILDDVPGFNLDMPLAENPSVELEWWQVEMQSVLQLFPEVEWDRWTGGIEASSAFGWLERSDGLRDFLIIRFLRGEVDTFSTSSARHSAWIAARLDFTHSDCKRMSDTFPDLRCVPAKNQADIR